jgi:hypothetical protein
MKWNVLLGTLVLAFGLCAQSYGFDLLDRMLGKGSGCCDPCAVQKSDGCKGASQKDGCCQKNGNGACQKDGKDGCCQKDGNGACQKNGKDGCCQKDGNGACQKDGKDGCCQKDGNGKDGCCQKDGKGATQKGKTCCQRGILGALIKPRCPVDCGKGGKGCGATQKDGCCQKDGNGKDGCCQKNGNGACQKDGKGAKCGGGGLLDQLFGCNRCAAKGGKGGCGAAQKDGCCQKDGNGKDGCCQKDPCGSKGGKGVVRGGLLDHLFGCNRCCGKGGKGSDMDPEPAKADPKDKTDKAPMPPAPVVDPSAFLNSRRVVPVTYVVR